MRQLLYATSNPGKFGEVSRLAGTFGIQLLSPSDLGLSLDPEETGTTLEENAMLKAHAYQQFLPPETYVITDDTGVEIDALNGEPGIHVRRWKDRSGRMSDEEIIVYTIERLRGIPLESRGAQMRTVLALGHPEGELELFDGVLRGVIIEEPTPQRIEGFPFESLLYIPEYRMMLGELHQLPDNLMAEYPTHRERALRKLLDRWREINA